MGDLTQHRVIPLARAAPFPREHIDEIYAFDPLDDAALSRMRSAALQLARIVGFPGVIAGTGAAGGTASTWRISDTAQECFGDEVPDDTMADAQRCVVRGDVALIEVEELGWLTAERVEAAQLEAWRREKLCGPHRDMRLAGDTQDELGRRYVAFDAALKAQRPVQVVGTPHQGPSAILEFLDSLRQAGQTPASHHLDWRGKSGVCEKSAACRGHKDWSEVLSAMLSLDELNLTALVSAEAVVRKIIQYETAVRRCPKQPDFDGLELMTLQVLDESGGATTTQFSNWLAARQKDEATVLKQGRLLREERRAELKRLDGKSAGDTGDKGKDKDKKKVTPGDAPGGHG